MKTDRKCAMIILQIQKKQKEQFMRTIRLCEYGVMPNTDITLSLYQLFLKYPSDTEFIFENDDYYFTPHKEMHNDYRLSNSDKMPYRVLGIWMKHMKNCVLCGNGARLWFSGHMQCITLDRCENIKFSGFTLNWKKPLVIEGTVVSLQEDSINIHIDPISFPHRFSRGALEYDIGNSEWLEVNSNIIVFEPYGRTVRRGTADVDIIEVSDLGNNIYSIKPKQTDTGVKVGDILNMRNGERRHTNIFTEKCQNVVIEDITVYSGGGLGCLSQFCHNLTFRRVHFLADSSLGRTVSGGHDDGMHLSCNSGIITVTECTFHALNDDPINVHGCCVTCDEVIDEKTLRCRYRHRQACGFLYWAEMGDTVSFIDRGSMSSVGTSVVKEYILETLETFLLTFDSPLPKEILNMALAGNTLAIDNLTHTADFVCTKNRFGSGRARGILVSTPRRVKITDNYFESAGSAILISGDSNYWFESGECHDVEISRNVFTDKCLTSHCQFCDGIISISPVIPVPDSNKPYHKNIRIFDNVFDCADTPLLYAFSCDGLDFTSNLILKSPSCNAYRSANKRIYLRYCKNARIENNQWIGLFTADVTVKSEICDKIVSDEITVIC